MARKLSSSKKVLIITQCYPPHAGSGVQRPLFFSKYLSELGWKCCILTTGEDDYPLQDSNLKKHIHSTTRVTRVNNPNAGEKLDGWCIKTDKKISMAISKLPIIWRLGNTLSKSTRILFRPAVRLLAVPDTLISILPKFLWEGHKVIRKEKPDIIFATSPPPTTLITGLILAKTHGLPWIADLRDEWSISPHNSYPTKLYGWLDQKIERLTLLNANKIVTTTPRITKDTAQQIDASPSLSCTITNGHNLDDFKKTVTNNNPQNQLNLLHSGVLPKGRSPESLIHSLKEIAEERQINSQTLTLHFAGYVDPYKHVLKHQQIKIHGYLSHPDTLDLIHQSDVLVLIAGQNEKRSYAGKIFEYLAAGKPLLILCPSDSATFELFSEISPHIYLADIADQETIKKHLLTLLNLSEKGRLPQFIKRPEANKYHRKQQARELHKLMLEVLTK